MTNERPFMHAWREAVRDSDLDKTAKLVAFVLSTYMNAVGGAFPSKATIARGASLSPRAVDAAVERLSEAGFATIERHRGGNSRRGFAYRASIPQQMPDGQPAEDAYWTAQPASDDIPNRHLTTSQPAAAAPEVEKEEVEKEEVVDEVVDDGEKSPGPIDDYEATPGAEINGDLADARRILVAAGFTPEKFW